MSDQLIDTSVIGDNRAVSPVIGVVILFGFLILALSLYQVEVVPQQNAEAEFQHSGEVRNDLVELRAGILQAGSIDQPQYQTVQLGTAYSSRTFTINPPSPAGTIRTTEPYPITISNNSGTPEGTITIPTRFIEYQPGYNRLDRSPTWYDASVLYLDARDDGGGIAVIEDQALVDDGGNVTITALQNEFRRSGTDKVTLELRPAENVTGDVPEGNLTVTIPTRLSESDWKDKTDLPTNGSVYRDVTDTGNEIDDMSIYNLTLNTTADNLTVDTVGVQEVPEDPTQNDAARVGGSVGGTGGDGYINGSQSECTTGVTAAGNSDDYSVTVELTNNGSCEPITLRGFGLAYDANGNTDIRKLARDGEDSPPEEQSPPDRSDEVNVSAIDDGSLSSNDKQGYAIDGLVNTLDNKATIKSSETAQISFGYFYTSRNPESNDPIQVTVSKESSPPSDKSYFTVKLKFSDGTQKNVYLSVSNINE